MFTSSSNNNNNNNNKKNMVVDGDEQQTSMFDNRAFENDISPSYKLDNLSLSFFHFSPATFLDQDDAFFQYHSQLLQSEVVVDSPTDSITTTMAAAEDHQTQTTTKLMATDDDNDPAASKFDLPNNNNNKVKTKSTSSSSTRKTPKRRLSGKKDRHSKIVTAQGTRDRRMRLSLPIAREFFSLQDMLGVDKPSKTVQWLLTMSKSAIEELTAISSSLSHRRRISSNKYHTAAGTGSASKSTNTTTTTTTTTTGSSMSDCEVVSEIEETVVTCTNQEEADRRRSTDFSKRKSLEMISSPSTSNKGKKMKPSSRARKITYQYPLARESRAKARARARARTIEKMQDGQKFIDNSKQCVPQNQLNINELKKVRSLTSSSSTTSKESEESAGSGTYDMKSTLEEMVINTDEVMIKYSSPSTEHQRHQGGTLVKDNMINVVDLDESFMITTSRKATSTSIFSYHDDIIGLIGSNNNNNNNTTSVLNFSEMWDFTNNAGQTNSSYCGFTDMNQLPAGNTQEYCLPSSSSIPLASPNTRLHSQFANLPLFCGKP